MTYEEALALLRGPGSGPRRITRPGLPGYGVVMRFGHPAIITGPGRIIAYTPTRQDLKAKDWDLYDRSEGASE